MEQVTLLKVFIASPSDTKEQRNEVEKVILKWNKDNTDREKIILMPVKWEDDAVASYNNNMSGQQVINNQLLLNSDILIALFNMKLGTPVDGYDSGTVQEIEKFYEKNKDHTGVFFLNVSNIPIEHYEEYGRVNKFKESLIKEKKGLYSDYSENNIFRYISIEVNKFKNEISNIVLDENIDKKKEFPLDLEAKTKLDNIVNDEIGEKEKIIDNIWNNHETVPKNLENVFLFIDEFYKFTKENIKTVSGKRYIYNFSGPVHPQGNSFISPKELFLPNVKRNIYFESNYSTYQGKKVSERLLKELNITNFEPKKKVLTKNNTTLTVFINNEIISDKNMNRLILKIIKEYQKQKNLNSDELKKIFNMLEYPTKNYDVIKTYSEFIDWNKDRKSTNTRYFDKKEDIIKTTNGPCVVSTEWGSPNFYPYMEKLSNKEDSIVLNW